MIIKTVIISLISSVIAIYFQIFFSLDNYPTYLGIFLFSTLILGLCYIFSEMINFMNRLSIK